MKKAWFHILLVVARGASHGAEIQRQTAERTGGEVTLYPVTLYRALDELADAGLIAETEAPGDEQHNEKRRYYLITPGGQEALVAEAAALEEAAREAKAAVRAARA